MPTGNDTLFTIHLDYFIEQRTLTLMIRDEPYHSLYMYDYGLLEGCKCTPEPD